MRLTLRSLLAYLYNVFEPGEAEEFGEKVHESAVASGLVQRIRGITKKVRMHAPKTDAKGLIEDANNVAEYLDNTLTEERVGDFERTVLESDMHLAEVASSYQILTMVLGKPADVPDAVRQRIYGLPKEAESSALAEPPLPESPERSRLKKSIAKVAAAAHAPKATAEVRTASTHPVPEVPDYLKQGERSRVLPIAVAALVVFLLVAAGIRMYGPYDRTNPALSWMFASSEVAQNPDDKQGEENKGQEGQPGTTGNGKENSSEGKTNGADEQNSKEPRGKEITPAETTPNPEKVAETENGKTKKLPVAPPVDVEGAAKVTPENPMLDPAGAGKEKPTTPPAEETPAEPTKTVLEPEKTEPAKTAKPAATAVKPAPAEAVEVARFNSDEQVLARLDAKETLWRRVAPRELLSAGERLQVLPTYRPQISLAAGVQVTFAGESMVTLEVAKEPGTSRMAVGYGRMVIVTAGMPGPKLELNLAGKEGTLVLSDVDSSAAVDVRRYLPPGADPADEAAGFPVIEIFVTSGRTTWQEGEKEPEVIPPGHVLTYVGPDEPDISGPFRAPAWIDAKSVAEIERVTSQEMEKLLDLEKPLDVRLQELLSDSRVEVRALAARCLGYLDQFDALLKELSIPQQKSFWAFEMDALRQALARGPQVTARLHESAERLRPKDADDIIRLLQGYGPEQLAAEGAKKLVESLENPEMDIRAIASDNLRRITGVTYLYRPERRPDENKLAITKWKTALKDETIAYKVPPAPLSERKPLEKEKEKEKGSASGAGGEKGT